MLSSSFLFPYVFNFFRRKRGKEISLKLIRRAQIRLKEKPTSMHSKLVHFPYFTFIFITFFTLKQEIFDFFQKNFLFFLRSTLFISRIHILIENIFHQIFRFSCIKHDWAFAFSPFICIFIFGSRLTD